MSKDHDANIKLLYPADEGTFFTSNDVAVGTAFDVIANVEIGKGLMQVVQSEALFVSVLNRSACAVLRRKNHAANLTAADDARNAEIRVSIPAGWNAAEGDVLEVIASYKVVAGVFIDFSIASSGYFVVTA